MQIYNQNNGSVRATNRTLRLIIERHNRSDESVIRAIRGLVSHHVYSNDNTHPQRRHTVRTEDDIVKPGDFKILKLNLKKNL